MLKSWHKDKRFSLILCLYFLLWMGGCEEYREGCMDISAVNFKADSQKPCCCEYPSLILQTTLTDGNKSVSFADTLTNQEGQKYLIRSMRFIFSEIKLQDSLHQFYYPIDTFGNHHIPPDVMAVNVKNLNNAGGEILVNKTFSRLLFSLKDVPALHDLKPASFPADHPLRDSSFYDFNTDRWIIAQATIGMEEGHQKTMKIYGSDLDIDTQIEDRWTKELGKDLTINFKINIHRLFSEMDLIQPEDQLREEFKIKLPVAFEP